MKILITGANGFIGKNLSAYLGVHHDVINIKRNSDGDKNSLSVDLTDTKKTKALFETPEFASIEVDIIIHCAAIIASEENNRDIDLFFDNNRITQTLIYLTNKLKAKKLINFSTIGVYPNADGIYSETSFIKTSQNAECLYSLSKFCSEELMNFYLNNINIINLRLSQTYGEGMRSDRIYSIFLKELLETNTITVWGNGERTSNFISIEYLLKLIDKIIINERITGTYNVGEANISYLQLAQQIIEKFGNSSSGIIKVDKGIKSKVIIDCSKINKILQYE
jgi:nucleoside-diphosphate-sugar epimerase